MKPEYCVDNKLDVLDGEINFAGFVLITAMALYIIQDFPTCGNTRTAPQMTAATNIEPIKCVVCKKRNFSQPGIVLRMLFCFFHDELTIKLVALRFLEILLCHFEEFRIAVDGNVSMNYDREERMGYVSGSYMA